MINFKENPVEWALLLCELDEFKEHLELLIGQMAKDGFIENEDYEVQIGHLYAHLNRSWNSRNASNLELEEKFNEFTKFPKDIETCG